MLVLTDGVLVVMYELVLCELAQIEVKWLLKA